jgi:hypothetical protein
LGAGGKFGLGGIVGYSSLLFRDDTQVFGFFHAEDVFLSGLEVLNEALSPALLAGLVPAKITAAT